MDDTINEAEQGFAVFLEVVDALDPVRVDLQSGRFASIARIFDDDRKEQILYIRVYASQA